jgi:hypothetical protein
MRVRQERGRGARDLRGEEEVMADVPGRIEGGLPAAA